MKAVNQQLIKNNNLKTLYQAIHQEPGVSRAGLAKLSGLSKPTVSSLVDELIERKFVEDTGITDDVVTVGRKPTGLRIRQGAHYTAVIAWNEREIRAKLVDICGAIVKEKSRILPGPDEYVGTSRELLDELLALEGVQERMIGVCIVVPAMIDPENEEIFATTLYLSKKGNQNLVKDLRETFAEYPVAVLNDTACAAYAEKIYTCVQQPDFAFINFQYGIGAALFIQNRLLGQATASYTQFGHYSVDPDGKQCSCGNKGCLELVIGENSLKERLVKTGLSSVLCRNKEISYQDLSSAALYGDHAARKVIEDLAGDFSQALNNLVCLVHPRLIIIGGKGKDLGPLFLEEVQANLKKTGFRQMLDSVQIRYSFLNSTAYFIGGMKYFFDIHYNFTQDMEHTFFLG